MLKSKCKFPYTIIVAGLIINLLIGCSDSKTEERAANSQDPGVNNPDVLARVMISNPSEYLRSDQVVSMSLAKLGLAPDNIPTQLSFYSESNPVPHQLVDRDGDGVDEQALVLLDLDGGATRQLEMRSGAVAEAGFSKRSHAEIGVKAGGRWNERKYEGGVFQDVESIDLPPQYTDHSQFIRYEGPGIESDIIGYRVYLDWRNGFDIFGKQQYGLHLDKVGLDGYDSYHEVADWGMDILKVGNSVGLGGFGYWENGAITRASDVAGWSARIVEDGDIYSAFAIDYDDWKIAGQVVDVTAQLSMVAGSPLVNVQLNTQPELEQLAIGIVKHADTEVITGNLDVTGQAWSYLATLGPQALDGRQLAMFVLFRRTTFSEFVEDEHNQAVLLKVRGGELEYYFGAKWAGEPEADLSREAVLAMLQKEVERLTYPPRLQIQNHLSDALKQKLGGSQAALQWSRRAAESEILRHGNELAFGEFDSMRQRQANWEYTTGLLTQSVYQLGKATNEEQFRDWAKGIIDSYLTPVGDIRTYDQSKFNIDSINAGKMLLQLYRDTGEDKYRLAARRLRDQLHHHPRLEAGAFWHKQRYPYQLWLDGVYMGIPFLVEYSLLFDDGASLEEAMQEFRVVRERLRNEETGLYWHAWDEKREQNWADPETGLSQYFWGRGMGWLAMAIVDTLELLPEEHGEMRAELAAMARDLADSLLKYQDSDGVWHQIVDMPGKIGNYQESSASAMYTYFLVKGVAIGTLPDSYKMAALGAYDALINEFVLLDANGNLHVTQACEVGGLGFGRDGSYEYYMSEPVIDNDPKVLGPFIMLGPLVQSILN